MRKTRVYRHLSCLLAAALLGSAGIVRGQPYVKRGTWHETLRHAREELAKAEANSQAGQPEVKLGVWYRIGPLKADPRKAFNTDFAPLKEDVDVRHKLAGQTWQPKPEYSDGVVHRLKAPGQTATFLYRTVTVTEPRRVTGYFGSDDGIGIWLNRRRVLANDAKRGPAPNQEKVELDLTPGVNHLLVMVFNHLGDHGFYFSTRSKPGSPGQAVRAELWAATARDFPGPKASREMAWEQADKIWTRDWAPGDVSELAGRYAAATTTSPFNEEARGAAASCRDERALAGLRQLYHLSKCAQDLEAMRGRMNFSGLRLAVEDLSKTYATAYPGQAMLARLDAVEARLQALSHQVSNGDAHALEEIPALQSHWEELRRDALLSNPCIDFDRVLFVKRKGSEGLTQNWQGNDRLHGKKFNNEIATFDIRSRDAEVETIHRPSEPMFVGDVDLHYDAGKLLFSTNGTVCETALDGSGFRKVITEIDSYDPCYLPDGRIIFASNSGYHAVPCVTGSDWVGNLHIANPDGSGIRRLCFDQDNNWCPVMLANGRVMYTRWEYTDSAHYFSRVLMHMNPDGTNQVEFYGSNSYWPNSIFYARPVPGRPTMFAAIVSGHHGPARMGELVLFDAAKGRREADGVIQRIPGRGKRVEPVIKDNLVGSSWPKFLHPFPLSDKHFLVACKLNSRSQWSIYLVDVYDNMLPIQSIPGYHCLEPIPVRQTQRPPIIADRIRPDDKEATVYIADIYEGSGLRGVPRGMVKELRVYQYEYAYRNMGGHYVIGYEGPWDVRRMLGTVPVLADGSALFKIPANTPVSLQPLDADGKALALMRSWSVGMPGEIVSCVGCHEGQNSTPFTHPTAASRTAPAAIEPWYGPTRGFSFRREIQPVLDKHCVGCHSEETPDTINLVDNGEQIGFPTAQSRYSKPYTALHPYVRRNGPEGDYHVLTPLEFHASTSELVQLLEKGHHGVGLDGEAWDRLITWIDLNVPYHGTWKEAVPKLTNELVKARYENRLKYSSVDEDIEEVLNPYVPGRVPFVKSDPPPMPQLSRASIDAWPIDTIAAQAMQKGDSLRIEMADGVEMTFAWIPAGAFMMGDPNGSLDEMPASPVEVSEPFWMLDQEVTNEHYRAFDPEHDSGVYDMRYKDQVDRGYYVNQPDKPVIRVSWEQAMAFCSWLAEQTGRKVALPTEAQWEWACRAGTDTPLSFGDTATNFAKYANLADVTTKKLAVIGVNPKPIPNPHPLAAYLPASLDVDDGVLHLAPPQRYAPNAWGLHDMHGNVAEWTRSTYTPYPYSEKDGRNDTSDPTARRVVRGGSWRDRPTRARSAFRLAYPGWQRVFNVGFRVVIEGAGAPDRRAQLSKPGG